MKRGGDPVYVRILGSIEAAAGGWPFALGGPTQRRVFAALVARRRDVLDVATLIEVCWPDGSVPERAEHNVRTYVHRLRSALGDHGDRIETIGTGYRLRLEPGEVDDDDVERLAGVAARAIATGDAVAALDALDEADALWRGRPYGEFADEYWAISECARLGELRVGMRERRGEALLAVGRAADAVAALEQLVRDEPLRERPRGLLMRALYESGRQTEALRVFQDFRRHVIEEAGVDPSPDLVALDRQIASGELGAVPAPTTVGNYELHERIGEGAFAVVHRATQPSLGREVAVKIVRAELANQPEFIRRFEAEAHMVARIEHPNVIPLYDYWREPDRAFLVMRWMVGGSLETRLDEGAWTLDDTIELVDQIAGALDAAHAAGVVHRDVKPANILFDDAGRGYLGDFGIALDADEHARPDAALSEGSPIFASPEQLRREAVGPEADVHALGIVAFTLLTGRTPFAEAVDEPTQLRRQLNDPIPSVHEIRPELPSAVDDVLAIATAKSPGDRYPAAGTFAVALRHAAIADTTTPVTLRPRHNPYKGLRAFDETDAADFHGRTRLVDEFVDHLSQPDTRMLAVVGPSGSGKSSVIRAGLLPAFRADRVPGAASWFVTSMIPGAHPFEALETALLRVAVRPPATLLDQLNDGDRGILRAVKRLLPADDGVVTVVIDQFEELFTSKVGDDQRDRFLRGLATAVDEPGSPIRLVITLRADFLERPLRHDRFAPLLKQHTVVVTPLAPDELEHAIVTPAAAVGVGFDPGLVAEIVADVHHEPGALPLLQYALTQMFSATEGDTIALGAYRSIGGISGALARQADELFAAADPAEQTATRRLFGRLVTLGEGTEDTRRRVVRSELGNDPATESALSRYGNARLLTFDRDPATREPTVEVAHEALIREWPRLRAWLDDDRDQLRTHRHLTTAATAWEGRERDPNELYRGARLDDAEPLLADPAVELNEIETDFLAASVRRRDELLATEQSRVRRLRRLVGATALIAVLALIAGGMAIFQWQRADDERARAESSADEADRNATEAAANAELAEQRAAEAEAAEVTADRERLRSLAVATAPERPEVAALLAVEAYRGDPSIEHLDVLHRVLTAVPGLRRTIEPSRRYARAELVGDTTLVTLGQSLDTWDLRTRELLQSIELPAGEVEGAWLTVSPDGRRAGVATGDRIAILDLEAGELVTSWTADAPVNDIAIDPTGSTVAIAEVDGTITLRPLDGDDEPNVLAVVPEVEYVRWHPSERALAAVTVTSAVHLWDVETGAERWSTAAADDTNVLNSLPRGIVFSPTGDLLVVDSGLLNPILRSYATEDGTEAFPPTRRTDGELGIDALFWLDAERRHLAVPRSKGIATYDLTTGLEVDGVRVDQLTIGDAVYSETLGEIITVLSGIVIRSADGSGPLERSIPLSPEQQAAIDAGGTVHPTISEDGSRVVVSAFVGANLPAATAFDLTGDRPTPTDHPFGNQLTFGNGPFTMTFSFSPPGFTLHDGDDRPVGSYPLTFDTTDQDASADGRFVATAASSGLVDLHAAGGELIHQFELDLPAGTDGAIVIPSLSDDGRFLAASGPILGGTNSPNAVWSTDTFERIDDGRFNGQMRMAGNLVANRTGGVVRLYSLPDLEPVGAPMVDEPGGQFYPAFDAAHGRLAVTSRSAVRVYDVESGLQIGSALPYRPIRIEYTADGTRLVVGSDDRVSVWNFDTDTWAEIACDVAGRNLTRDEWEQFGPRTIDYRATCDQFPIDP